jgi:hypothetical protein
MDNNICLIFINDKKVILPTTTKPYPTKWGRLHGSNDAIMFYHIPYFYPNQKGNWDSTYS